ncbi:MAG: VTT domain-containing protein [Anaerolineaceae bacterium]
MNPKLLTVIRVLAIILVIGVTVLLYLNRDKVSQLGVFGYPGIFLISMLSNASLILPIPGVLFTSAMGAVFNPWWVALAAGSGATLGELSGYMAGFSGQGIVENRKWYDRVSAWIKDYGDFTIFILALIPNPLFDIGGMVAGALRMPLWRFLLFCWLGKIGKMLLFAFGGSSVLKLFGL